MQKLKRTITLKKLGQNQLLEVKSLIVDSIEANKTNSDQNGQNQMLHFYEVEEIVRKVISIEDILKQEDAGEKSSEWIELSQIKR